MKGTNDMKKDPVLNYELKNCPFCPDGGVPHIQAHGFGNFSGCCGTCGTQNRQTRGVKNAIEIWNTRTEPTRAMDNAWHAALPCPFHIAYKEMMAASPKKA